MTIKDIWLIDSLINNDEIISTLSDLILLIQEKMNDSKSWDYLIDVKYFHNDKEGWMAICHFQ